MDELIKKIGLGFQNLNARKDGRSGDSYGASVPISLSAVGISFLDKICDFIQKQSDELRHLSYGVY